MGFVEPEVLDVWPEHWQAVHVFAAMGTQWNVGMAGPIGLRYEALPLVMKMRRVPREDRPQVFDCLRVMEGEALRVFAERRTETGER
jgi:hypothetical protein